MVRISFSKWLKYNLFIIFLLSCSRKSDSDSLILKEIDVESHIGGGKIVPLSEVASEIQYIRLETTGSSLIEYKRTVFIENERIYVRSGAKKHLTVFDMQGRFLFRFDRRGRGAEEYSHVQSVDIEPGTGNILISDYTNLKLYDRDGNFLKIIEYPKIDKSYFTYANFLSKDTLIAAPKNASPDSKSFVIFNKESEVLKTIPMPALPAEKTRVNYVTSNAVAYSTSGSSNIVRGKDRSVIYYQECDTMFSLDKKLNYSPEYRIKIGRFINRKAGRKDVDRVSGKHVSLSTTQINQAVFETPEFLCISYNLRDYAHEKYIFDVNFSKKEIYLSECISLYNKRTEAFTFLNHPQKGRSGFKEDFCNGPAFFPLTTTSGNSIVSLLTATQIIEYASQNAVEGELKEIVATLKESDNPVVAIAKLKN
ncbi:MAG: 6-bladed beta-propeller [Bacteroidales bacterium]